MPYVLRNEADHIVAVLSEFIDGAQFVSPSDTALRDFLCSSSPEQHAKEALQESDHGLVRVIEDLINILLHSGTVKFSDFPVPAQQKLLSRLSIRSGFLSSDDPQMISPAWEQDDQVDNFI